MNEELTAKYRATFLSPTGMEVLGDILIDLCHFGKTLNNEEMMNQYNIGVGVLARMGVFSEETRFDVLGALSSVAPKAINKPSDNALDYLGEEET